MKTARQLRRENTRLRASLSSIHNALHADDVNKAHELCECALAGESVSQPNLSTSDAANAMSFAAAFNQLTERSGFRACCVMLLPSATVQNAVSLQLCGEVETCKIVERMLRGQASTYMGDHEKETG